MPARYTILLFSVFIIYCREYPTYPHGGYEYPKNIADSDINLYFHQLTGLTPERETFNDSYIYLFFRAFNEPNLSIRPQPKETFRLTYETAFQEYVIIVFNEDSLIVKKNNGTTAYKEDTAALTAIEKVHYKLLQRRYPIDTTTKRPWLKRHLDSMVKLYPQLLDPAYYHKLVDKTIAYSDEKFSPQIMKYPLTKVQYRSLIEAINTSGFWSMPYRINCEVAVADGDGFTFEANTKKRYKVVTVTGCPGDTSNFTKACQKIVEAAKMDKEVQLIWRDEGSGKPAEPVEVKDVTLEPVKK
jgi:hypothetical protein